MESFFETICTTLESGENVRLSQLGKLNLRDKKIRIDRNPRTKKSYAISARRVVVFHTGPKY